jgi:DNA-binding transcriptional LysR family regulator
LDNIRNNLGIDYECIYREHVCACVNSSHSLAQRVIVTPDDLRMEKLVMDNSNYIKDFYRKYLNGNEILLISNNSELLKLSVLNENAVLLLLNFTLNRHVDVIDKKLSIVPFSNQGLIMMNLWILYPSTKRLTLISRMFVENVINLL